VKVASPGRGFCMATVCSLEMVATSRKAVPSFLSQHPRKDCNRLPGVLFEAPMGSLAWKANEPEGEAPEAAVVKLCRCWTGPDSKLSAPWLLV